MGWDTQVTILCERVEQFDTVMSFFFEQDARHYQQKHEKTQAFTRESTLFFSYERRKYAPYWVVESLSRELPKVLFTLLADSPDFLGGPGGLVRISGGQILDSYGLTDGRQDMLESPHPEQIYRWFQYGGPEEKSRLKEGSDHPEGEEHWDYVSRIFENDLDEDVSKLLEGYKEIPLAYGWKSAPLTE